MDGKDNHIPVLCQWAPKGFGDFPNPLLLTADLFPLIRIWTTPSSLLLRQMEVLCDLSELITSSESYRQTCSSVTTIQVAFSEDSHSFVISVEAVVFFFSMTCVDHEVTIHFWGSFTYDTVITSLCWMNSELVFGTATGGLCGIAPGFVNTDKEITQVSNTMEEEGTPYNREQNIIQAESAKLLDSPFRLQGGETYFMWSLVLMSVEYVKMDSSNTNILWKLSSIYTEDIPLQSSIQSIQRVGSSLLVSDGVSICWINIKNGEVIKQWIFEVREGISFFTAGNDTPLIQCITKRFHYKVIDLTQSRILMDHCLAEDFSRYSDVIYLGSASLQAPAVLVASQVITSQRTTSVDMTRQLLVIKSYGFMKELCSQSAVVLVQQMVLESLQEIWERIPTASTQELQCIHIYISVNMRQGKAWWFGPQMGAVEKLLALRRRLWLEALRQQPSVGSQWICKELEGYPEGLPEVLNECICCGEKTFLHKNHTSWCLLQYIDDYCPLTFLPIITGEVLVCPCCYIAYLQGEECVFCGLRLIRAIQYQRTNAISRQRINEYHCNSCMVDWNVL